MIQVFATADALADAVARQIVGCAGDAIAATPVAATKFRRVICVFMDFLLPGQ